MDHSPPDFTPVPVRPRRDGWTPDRQRGFIAALVESRCPSRAARAVGLSRESAYRLRARADAGSFAAAWDAALAAPPPGASAAGCWERAFKGVMVPIVYRGRTVGERRKLDDRAACIILANVYAQRDARRAERKAAKKAARKG